jgi:hypothetical protein
MRQRLALAAACALAFAPSVVLAKQACTRLAFSVNDYGKDGPTKDAKELLDKYIAKWAAERGIKKYNVGKKDVSCELFLNFIVFDEHTCKAAASVCWDDTQVPQQVGITAQPAGGTAPRPAADPAKTKAVKKGAAIETGSSPNVAPKAK